MVNLNLYRKASTNHSAELFVEVQQYRRVWMWVLLGLTSLTLMAVAVTQQVLPGFTEYWLSLSSLALIGIVLLLLAGLVYKAHMVTKINSQGIQFRLFPFQWFYQHIDWQEVEEVYI